MNKKPGAHELAHPTLAVTLDDLQQFFARGLAPRPLRNPHVEPRVSEEIVSRATPAAVLLPILDLPQPRLLVTRRHAAIRFAGHLCFPGGKVDSADAHPVATALRESQEEIGLDPAAVQVLGSLGDYVTQTGFRITPVVALVDPVAKLTPSPFEVEAIHEVSFERVFSAASYSLTWRGQDRGHFSFTEGDLRIAGPTVSIMIGLYETLLDKTPLDKTLQGVGP